MPKSVVIKAIFTYYYCVTFASASLLGSNSKLVTPFIPRFALMSNCSIAKPLICIYLALLLSPHTHFVPEPLLIYRQTDRQNCIDNNKSKLDLHGMCIGETGANWDTFIIYRPGADDNRVRDSKQSFKLGMVFVIVTRAFNKSQLKPIPIWRIFKKKKCPSFPRIRG